MEVRHLGFDDDLGERRIADDEVVGDRVVRPAASAVPRLIAVVVLPTPPF